MKRLMLFILGVLLLLPTFARDFTYTYENQTLTYTVLDEEAKTCQTKEHYANEVEYSVSGNLIIPDVAKDGDDEYSVTEIGLASFAKCSDLISVVIPCSVTKIGNSAFLSCTGLKSVQIPNSVKEIGSRSFYDCTGLWSLNLPNSIVLIGVGAFCGCENIKSIAIPGSVTYIGENAFYNCRGLLKAIYPSDLSNPFVGTKYSNTNKIFSYPREGSITEDGFVYGPDRSTIYFAPADINDGYTIPESVTKIGDWSFYRCGLLSSLVIPSSVTEIGEDSFHSCSGLEFVIIPPSVKMIKLHAFSECYNLIKYAYPSNVGADFVSGRKIRYPADDALIEDGMVFSSDKSSIYFIPPSIKDKYVVPASVTNIGEQAFADCTRLTSIEIGDSVTEIGGKAFIGCTGLMSLAIGNSVENIGDYAFGDCSGLTSLAIGNSVKNIGDYAFKGCTGLTSLAIGNSVKNIGDYAFKGCTGLTSLAIGNSVKNIGGYAFKGCTGLTALDLGDSIASIGGEAFMECPEISSITCRNIIPALISISTFDGIYDSAVVSVPANSVSEYLSTNWEQFENIRAGNSEAVLNTFETGNLKYRLIPAATEQDKNLAVIVQGDYSDLTEITIPERITVSDKGLNERYYVDAVGYKAFSGCNNLKTITFNSRNAVRFIGSSAFSSTPISAITLPETVVSVGSHAFEYCGSLVNIFLPESVETIGDYAFSNCGSLLECVISTNVKSIGDYAFNNCSALTEINIPSSVETIGDYTFYNTSKLSKVTFNEGLLTIGNNAFSAANARSASSIDIPSTLVSIGSKAFYNFKCQSVNISNLASWCNIDFATPTSNPACYPENLYLDNEVITHLVIPESVKQIKANGFCWNKNLESVSLPGNLQSIGDYAFYDCDGLTYIEIPGSVTTIGESAFRLSGIVEYKFQYGLEEIKFDSSSLISPEVLSWDRPLKSLNISDYRLRKLTIGNSISEIPATTFKGISALTDLTLGSNITVIGDEAFSECTNLTEVVIPPSVEIIGERAFSGNTQLTCIIMGDHVKNIGKKAFDLCPAQTVCITAQTPPDAPDNTFSNYTGSLYVQGREALDVYYDADYCWFQFEGHELIEPTDLRIDGDKALVGKPGDTFQLNATLSPDNVSLPQIFWRSTNPEIASVDCNGLVTLHADMADIMAVSEDDGSTASLCKIIAESLYADGPIAEVMVNNRQVNVDSILDNYVAEEIDFSAPVEIFNLQGVKVATAQDGLSKGIYIVRQGKNIKKIAVK